MKRIGRLAWSDPVILINTGGPDITGQSEWPKGPTPPHQAIYREGKGSSLAIWEGKGSRKGVKSSNMGGKGVKSSNMGGKGVKSSNM
jgi:hypothetical protein